MEINCKYDKLVSVDELKPHPQNRNLHECNDEHCTRENHPFEQIILLAKLIRYQGWRHPIIVSNLSSYVVAGHGRIEAAKENGEDKVPVVFQDFATHEQEIAFLNSDNAIAEYSTLDLKGIGEDILDFGPDFDTELLGILDFKIDTSELDFSPGSEDDQQALDKTQVIECPHCRECFERSEAKIIN